MNLIIVSGRLTKDAQFKADPNDPKKNRSFYTVAVKRGLSASSQVDYFDCVAFGERANFVGRGLEMGTFRKGCWTEVKGQMQLNTKEDNGSQKVDIKPQIMVETHESHSNGNTQSAGNDQGQRQWQGNGNYQRQPQQGGYQTPAQSQGQYPYGGSGYQQGYQNQGQQSYGGSGYQQQGYQTPAQGQQPYGGSNYQQGYQQSQPQEQQTYSGSGYQQGGSQTPAQGQQPYGNYQQGNPQTPAQSQNQAYNQGGYSPATNYAPAGYTPQDG